MGGRVRYQPLQDLLDDDVLLRLEEYKKQKKAHKEKEVADALEKEALMHERFEMEESKWRHGVSGCAVLTHLW